MKFQFESLTDLFWMSGHGPYVWSAYGITFAAIIVLVVSFLLARKNFFKQQRSIAQRAMSDLQQENPTTASSDLSSDTSNTESSV